MNVEQHHVQWGIGIRNGRVVSIGVVNHDALIYEIDQVVAIVERLRQRHPQWNDRDLYHALLGFIWSDVTGIKPEVGPPFG